MTMTTNLTPSNAEAEQAVIGSVLIDPEGITRIDLTPQEFYYLRTRMLYAAILDLHRAGKPLDFIILAEELEHRKQLEQIGGVAYIAQMLNYVPSAINIEHYAQLIRHAAQQRAALAIAEELAKAAHNATNGDLAHALLSIQNQLHALTPQPETPAATAAPAIPPLPEIGLEPDRAARGGFIDAYTAYAVGVSPMTPTAFHTSAALWLLSSAVARRLVLNMSFDRIYPNLWIAWIAPSTLWGKSTSMNLARRVALGAYAHLLTPEDMTPEGLMLDMSGNAPQNLPQMRMEDQNAWNERRNYAAQRAWTMDEFSGLLASAGRDYNAGLIETLMRFYDCTEKYDRLTAGRGLQCIHSAYLTLLSASTPVAVAGHMINERLWGMGWWPRFIILAPETRRPAWAEPLQQEPPAALIAQLAALYKRLPQPRWPDPIADIPVLLGPGVHDLWNRYNKVLRYDLLTDELDGRLWAAYGRLPVHALKVATLLAAADWEGATPRIELPHITRALLLTEEWRASLHRVLELANQESGDRLRQLLIYQISRADPLGATMRDLLKACGRRFKVFEIEHALEELLLGGDIISTENGNPRGGPKTNRYVLNRG